jgi:hypothetical protein
LYHWHLPSSKGSGLFFVFLVISLDWSTDRLKTNKTHYIKEYCEILNYIALWCKYLAEGTTDHRCWLVSIPTPYTGVQAINLGTETGCGVIFEILREVKISMLVFSAVTQFRLVGRYQRFILSKPWYLPASNGVTNQKINIDTVGDDRDFYWT